MVQSYFAVGAAELVLETSRRTAPRGRGISEIDARTGTRRRSGALGCDQGGVASAGPAAQLQEAQLTLLNARLDLAVLIFPDFNDNFETADDLHLNVPLRTRRI